MIHLDPRDGGKWWEVTDIKTGEAEERGDLPTGLDTPRATVSVGGRVFVCDDTGQWYKITNIETGGTAAASVRSRRIEENVQ